MPRYLNSDPPIRFHKGKRQAYVTLSGRQVLLGAWDGKGPKPPAVRRAYRKAIEQWENTGRTSPPPSPAELEADAAPELLLEDLLVGFLAYATKHYPTTPTGRCEADSYRAPMRVLRALYGDYPLRQFGAPELERVRDEMVRRGWVLSSINRQISRVRRIFKWGVSRRMVSGGVMEELRSLDALLSGRGDVEESEPVRPVPDADIKAALREMSRPVRALVLLQLHTGARPSELLTLCACDIDRTKEPWERRMVHHKTARKGQSRVILFGPPAREVLAGLIEGRDPHAPLFSPRESVAELKARGATKRRRPNQKPSPCQTERLVGETFDSAAYRRSIRYACERAKVPVWTPYRLRHNAATAARSYGGIDVAAAVLGHAHGSRVTAETLRRGRPCSRPPGGRGDWLTPNFAAAGSVPEAASTVQGTPTSDKTRTRTTTRTTAPP